MRLFGFKNLREWDRSLRRAMLIIAAWSRSLTSSKGCSIRLLHNLQLHGVYQDIVNVELRAIIAGGPAFIRPRQRKRSMSGWTVSDRGSFVRAIISGSVVANVLSDPVHADLCAFSQAMSFPAHINLKCVRRKCRGRSTKALFGNTHGKFLRRRLHVNFRSVHNFGTFRQFKRNALKQITAGIAQGCDVFDDSGPAHEPAV